MNNSSFYKDVKLQLTHRSVCAGFLFNGKKKTLFRLGHAHGYSLEKRTLITDIVLIYDWLKAERSEVITEAQAIKQHSNGPLRGRSLKGYFR